MKKLTALSLTALLLLLPFAVTHAEGEPESEPAPEGQKDEIVSYNLTEMVFKYGVEGTMAKLKEGGFESSFVDGMESYLHDLIRRNTRDTKETPAPDTTESNDLTRVMSFCEYGSPRYGWWESSRGILYSTFDYIDPNGRFGTVRVTEKICWNDICGWVDHAYGHPQRRYVRFNAIFPAIRIMSAECQYLN